MSEQEATFEPLSASADGTRNMYFFTCTVIGQSVNYAACLWRQGCLEKPDIKTPESWEDCRKGAKCNSCPALSMRKEEEVKGHAIYLRAASFPKTGTKARWCERKTETPTTTVRTSTPAIAPARKAQSIFDGLDGGEDMSLAITESNAEHNKPVASEEAPSTPVDTKSTPKFDIRPGESPLAAMRRMNKEQS